MKIIKIIMMLIPAAIGLLISTVFLNLGLSLGGYFLTPGGEPLKGGKVLGAIEYGGNSFNKAVAGAIEGAKFLPLFQKPPSAGYLMKQLPENKDREIDSAVVSYDLPAENGVIFDYSGGGLFFSKNPDRAWPIASITKLFTAYTFLDYNPGWEAGYEIKADDKREGGKIHLFTGDKVKIKDLFYFSLVGSDNTATAALVRSTGLSEPEFVEKMNDKIKNLGFKNTRFVDAVGLADGNVSTAREIAQFAKIAMANREISGATLTKKYEFTTEQGKRKSISSTDQLLKVFPENGVKILGGKTGFINSSGYCLVSRFKNHENKEIITVVLGANSDGARFDLTKKLVELYYGGKQ